MCVIRYQQFGFNSKSSIPYFSICMRSDPFDVCSFTRGNFHKSRLHLGMGRWSEKGNFLKKFMDLLASVYSWLRRIEWWKLALFVHYSVPECLANQQTTILKLGLSVALFELNRTTCWDFIAFLLLPKGQVDGAQGIPFLNKIQMFESTGWNCALAYFFQVIACQPCPFMMTSNVYVAQY